MTHSHLGRQAIQDIHSDVSACAEVQVAGRLALADAFSQVVGHLDASRALRGGVVGTSKCGALYQAMPRTGGRWGGFRLQAALSRWGGRSGGRSRCNAGACNPHTPPSPKTGNLITSGLTPQSFRLQR